MGGLIEQISLYANGLILVGMKYYAFTCIFKPATRKVWIFCAYLVFLIATTLLFLQFENIWITLAINMTAYIALSFLFSGNIGIKIIFAILLYITSILADGVSFLLLNNIYYTQHSLDISIENILPIGRTVTTIIHLPCILAIILIFRKFVNKRARYRTFKIPLRYTSIVLFMLLGIAFVNTLFISATIDEIQRSANRILIAHLVSAVVIIAIIWLYNTILNHLEEFERNRLKDKMLERWEVQYQTAASSQKLIATLKHNMGFDYLSLASFLDKGEVINAQKLIADKVGILNSIVATENISIDTMLNYYQQKAREVVHISLDIGIFIPPDLRLDANLTALILGNALENALDACSHLPISQRYIQVKMELTEQGELLVTIINPYVEEPIEDENGNLVTSKADKLNHGLGLSSIQEILPEEAGQIHYKYDKGVFQFMLLFYNVLP